jgi:hypothetical protein
MLCVRAAHDEYLQGILKASDASDFGYDWPETQIQAFLNYSSRYVFIHNEWRPGYTAQTPVTNLRTVWRG